MTDDHAPKIPAPLRTAVREYTDALVVARSEARDAAKSAIDAMLAALASILPSPAFLRGAPNLGSSADPVRGYLVRARSSYKALPFPRCDGVDQRDVLILSEDCRIMMAHRSALGPVVMRPAVADDLLAEDAEHVAETIILACEAHVEACRDRTERVEAIRDLSLRITVALEGV